MNDPKNTDNKNSLNIEITDEISQGTYSNLAIIAHSKAEFVIDFTRVLPGTPKAKVHSRIIMTPQHAKMLARALNDNISKFESVNGEIRVEGSGNINNFPGFEGDSGNTKIN
ncbi:MAG: DUF3467 domain-containing protein [Candidatus Kapaibacterium sp.]|nr:DUF3467 domain-containing protein [Ignavibacteriota bacterium]MCB9220937.1 DUF3467 domain-containing protein [Ignavibacteria bacterium]